MKFIRPKTGHTTYAHTMLHAKSKQTGMKVGHELDTRSLQFQGGVIRIGIPNARLSGAAWDLRVYRVLRMRIGRRGQCRQGWGNWVVDLFRHRCLSNRCFGSGRTDYRRLPWKRRRGGRWKRPIRRNWGRECGDLRRNRRDGRRSHE